MIITRKKKKKIQIKKPTGDNWQPIINSNGAAIAKRFAKTYSDLASMSIRNSKKQVLQISRLAKELGDRQINQTSVGIDTIKNAGEFNKARMVDGIFNIEMPIDLQKRIADSRKARK